MLAGYASLGHAAHAETNVFAAPTVAIDQTSQTTQSAKDIAIAEGERKALNLLFARITAPADEARLPKPAEREISSLINGYEVANERLSPVRYIADLTVTFDARGIRSLLRSANIPFAEPSTRRVLVLPILSESDRTTLWDQPNGWSQAWAGTHGAGVLVRTVLPPHGAPTIDAEHAISGPPSQFDALAAQVDASGVVVAEAIATPGAVTVKARKDGEVIDGETLLAAPGEAREHLFQRAVASVLAVLDERWKQGNLVSFDQSGSITARVPLRSFDEWVRVRRILGDMPQIQKVTVDELNRREAVLHLDYAGDPAQIRTMLAQHALSLEGSDDAYILRLHSP
jgi:hypothetical protein